MFLIYFNHKYTPKFKFPPHTYIYVYPANSPTSNFFPFLKKNTSLKHIKSINNQTPIFISAFFPTISYKVNSIDNHIMGIDNNMPANANEVNPDANKLNPNANKLNTNANKLNPDANKLNPNANKLNTNAYKLNPIANKVLNLVN